jgi:hypothetical protein
MDKAFYQTSDINVACFLATLGYQMTINPFDPYKVLFLFDRNEYPELDRAVNDYWADRYFELSPKLLFASRRDLMTRVRDAVKSFREE